MKHLKAFESFDNSTSYTYKDNDIAMELIKNSTDDDNLWSEIEELISKLESDPYLSKKGGIQPTLRLYAKEALKNGKFNLFKKIVDYGLDLTWRDYNIIKTAIYTGNIESVSLVLETIESMFNWNIDQEWYDSNNIDLWLKHGNHLDPEYIDEVEKLLRSNFK